MGNHPNQPFFFARDHECLPESGQFYLTCPTNGRRPEVISDEGRYELKVCSGCKIELGPPYAKCPICEGRGETRIPSNERDNQQACSRCGGKGKISA